MPATKARKLTVRLVNDNGRLRTEGRSRTILTMDQRDEHAPDQKEQLGQLGLLEEKLAHLKEKEAGLEVECIIASTAMEHANLERVENININIKTAAAIVLSLDRKRAFSEEFSKRKKAGEKKTQHYRAAIAALESWLSADEQKQVQGGSPAVRVVFMLLTLATIAAAVGIHWAFLVLLVPIGATSTMLWSGHDASWQRVGAKRRFEQTGLSPIDDWTPDTVQERIDTLRQLIEATFDSNANHESGTGEEDGDSEVDVAEELSALLASIGLSEESLDEKTESELRLVSRSFIARRELDALKRVLESTGAKAEQIRSSLYRYLNRHGVGPGEGRADLASLVAGFARLRPGE